VTRQEKIQAARTEGLFRHVNDHIAAVAEHSLVDEAHFVCECANPGCAEKIEAPLDEYEDVRTDPRRFLVKRGHADESVEVVVSDEGTYEVVEKDVIPPPPRDSLL
jgi:hypothetical protein